MRVYVGSNKAQNILLKTDKIEEQIMQYVFTLTIFALLIVILIMSYKDRRRK